jgi:S1-C subfamily serine protease
MVGIDDDKVESYDDLYNSLDGKKPGTKVSVKRIRAGKPLTLSMEVVVVQ